jgi:hypothetical protein
MNSSYRVRTQIGVDKSVPVDLEQDFEVLEILSLKIYQREIYNRVCSDYGVICGRIFANNGFGIPNAKISLFIPLSDDDSRNPEITDLYPFTSIDNLDVNGYRYNLLPKEQSHSGHVPTGTFPTREEILLQKDYSEVYEKYYKYTVKTNDSGDYMIFGMPVGSYTIVVDIDLSDIGQFSLTPQDLIRMGMATESQVSGSKFISSSNLNSLPQIINITKQVEVLPLWGNEEICQPSITRTDFDLTLEANVDLTPTSVFIGSIMSTEDEISVSNICKVNKKVGDFCKLVAGPGQILAIRHTINYDTDPLSPTYGYPQLEEYKLPNNGQVIDENGAWLVELPMNLDYVYTNEFGEQVISTDPNIGVPTKAKYRFKIKWNQSPSLSEEIRRGYFLVPNVKEWGWGAPGNSYEDDENPAFFPQYSQNDDYKRYQQSYAFSLDWNDYGDPDTTEGQQMLQEAINCEDRFFLFEFKKVYTISQLMDKYKNGNNDKYIGIKNILNGDCSSENNKYPVNDGHKGSSIMFLIFRYLLSTTKMLLFPIAVVLHAVSLVVYIVQFLLQWLIWSIYAPIYYFIQGLVNVVNWLAPGSPLSNPFNKTPAQLSRIIFDKVRIKQIPLPLLLQSEGDCTFCSCKENESSQEYSNPLAASLLSEAGNSCNFPLNDGGQTNTVIDLGGNLNIDFQVVVGGLSSSSSNASIRIPTSAYIQPYSDGGLNFDEDKDWIFSNHLTFAERQNVSNTKQKYFSNSNLIRTYVEPTLNGEQFHTDNTLIYLINGCDDIYKTGNLIVFQDPSLSLDLNGEIAAIPNEDGGYQITGTSTSATSVNIVYAPLGSSLTETKTYNLPLKDSVDYIKYAKYKFDLEYFQVVTAITYNDLVTLGSNTATSLESHGTYYHRIFRSPFMINMAESQSGNDGSKFKVKPKGYVSLNSGLFSDLTNSKVVILVRGVDPYSPKYNIKYDISRLLNRPNGTVFVEGDYRLNVPIQPGGTSIENKQRSTRHHLIANNNSGDVYGGKLFFPSWFFQPGSEFQPFQTEMTKYYGSMDSSLTNNFSVLSGYANETKLTSQQVNYPSSNIMSVRMFGGSLDCGLGTSFGCNIFTAHREIEGDQKWGIPEKPEDGVIVNGITENGGNTWGGSGYMLYTSSYCGDSVEGASLMWQVFGQHNNNNWRRSRAIYYSPAYTTTSGVTGTYGTDGKTLINNSTNIVFRSDRLPTSTTEKRNGNNSLLFTQNKNFTAFVINDEGETVASSDSSVDGIDFEQAFFDDGSTLQGINDQVVASFSDCQNAVPFKCYNITEDGVVIIDDFPDCTTGPFNVPFFQNGNGCYRLVTVPIIGIPYDFVRINEWYRRIVTNLFLCMDGIEYDYYNNWITGNLFMPTFYLTTFSDSANRPNRKYCNDILVYHEASKNFYYRSSPYRYGYGFIGARTRQKNEIAGLNNYVRGNYRNLKTPTTIINLGPLTSYTQELTQGVGYSGYIANYLTPTSYRDITDITNFFVISRQLESSYEQNVNLSIGLTLAVINPGLLFLFGVGDPLKNFFGERNSRENNKVDADLAQLISINSEFGVRPFSPGGYPSSSSVRIMPLYNLFDFNTITLLILTGASALLTPAKFVTGIFFESYNFKRDALTPKRIVWNNNAQVPFQPNDITNYPQPSQEVPFYQWNLDYVTRAQFIELPLNINVPYPLLNHEIIFGSWKNDWNTEPITNNLTFFSRKIQDMDRTNNTSRYFMPNTNKAKYMKGFIYNVDESGNLEESLVNITESNYSVGAPYHFYFGLKKGRSAMDLFFIKYVDTEIVID